MVILQVLFAMQDIIRPSSIELIKKLKYIGLKDIYLLTGDTFDAASDVAKDYLLIKTKYLVVMIISKRRNLLKNIKKMVILLWSEME